MKVTELPKARDRLATATTDSGEQLIGTVGALYWGTDPVQRFPWVQLVNMHFSNEDNELTWVTDQGSHTVTLEKPGRLPELMFERIEASILTRKEVEIAGLKVLLIARRDEKGECVWQMQTTSALPASAAEELAEVIRQTKLDLGI